MDEKATNEAYPGHGTHVAGIIAASTHDPTDSVGGNNPPEVGVAGVCWRCSLAISRISKYQYNANTRRYSIVITDAAVASGITHAVQAGTQAINMSFGSNTSPPLACGGNANASICDALELADTYEVNLVGASGNVSDADDVQFPANDARVIPVAGIQAGSSSLWRNTDQYISQLGTTDSEFGSSVGPSMAQRGLLAPARDVLSTVYTNYDWNPGGRCGDSDPFNWPSHTMNLPGSNGSIVAAGYGVCTGTSMAAPHVTGIMALMRSVDPMQPSSVVRSRLLITADNAPSPSEQRGYGVPRASMAVNAMLTGNSYRLTPLFAQFGACGGTRFYTVVPQMAMAAFNGTLPVGKLSGCKIYPNVLQEGTTINNGKSSYYYPGGNPTYHTARAHVWVFSTHNPRNSSLELKPLYRLSRRHGSETLINHVYSTDYAEVQGFINTKHYKLDGIEGYVYPANESQPAGAVRLMRASKDSTQNTQFAVFPETLQTTMQSQGYIHGTTTLGWAFPNDGNRPTY